MGGTCSSPHLQHQMLKLNSNQDVLWDAANYLKGPKNVKVNNNCRGKMDWSKVFKSIHWICMVFFNSCFAHISSVCCKCFNMPSKSKANHSKLLRVPDGLRMPETCSAVTNNRPPLFSRFSVPHQLCQNHPPEWFSQVKASHVLDRVQNPWEASASRKTRMLWSWQPSQPSFGWPKPMYYTCRGPLAPKPLWLAHRVQLLPEVVADRCLFKCQWRLMETYRCLYIKLEHHVYSIL